MGPMAAPKAAERPAEPARWVVDDARGAGGVLGAGAAQNGEKTHEKNGCPQKGSTTTREKATWEQGIPCELISFTMALQLRLVGLQYGRTPAPDGRCFCSIRWTCRFSAVVGFGVFVFQNVPYLGWDQL